MISEFKKGHSGCRVDDGFMKERLEARIISIATIQWRKTELSYL